MPELKLSIDVLLSRPRILMKIIRIETKQRIGLGSMAWPTAHSRSRPRTTESKWTRHHRSGRTKSELQWVPRLVQQPASTSNGSKQDEWTFRDNASSYWYSRIYRYGQRTQQHCSFATNMIRKQSEEQGAAQTAQWRHRTDPGSHVGADRSRGQRRFVRTEQWQWRRRPSDRKSMSQTTGIRLTQNGKGWT